MLQTISLLVASGSVLLYLGTNVENQNSVKLLETLFILSTEAKVVLELSLLQTTPLPHKPQHVSKDLVSSPTKIIIKVLCGWDKLDHKLSSPI